MGGEKRFDGNMTAPAPEPGLTAHLLQLFAADTIEAAWALHLDRMRGFGFDRVSYVHAPLSSNFSEVDGALVLSNVPRACIDEYVRQGHSQLTVFLGRAERAGVDCISWRPPPPETLSPAEARAIAFRHSHGMVAGYSISLRGLTARGRAGIGLCARGLDQDTVDAIWDRHGDTLRVLNKAFHLRVSTLPREIGGGALSERQREALEWAATGKTLREIATLMGVSVPTVEKHLRLAREKLGAQTTAQALVLASVCNQILRLDVSAFSPPSPGGRADRAG
jgi:DNA-binding CsgD family transcriptional regulator